MEIGFIGVGQMGSAIAMRLMRTYGRLHLYDPDWSAVTAFTDRGCIAYGNPREVADAADIVFSCVPNTQASLAVAIGQDGVAHGCRAKFHVEMSTIGVAGIRTIAAKLAETGKTTIDAPVSGGPPKARDGKLTVIAAGPADGLAAIDELLHAIGKNVFIVGSEAGPAQAMKLVNNMVSAACMAATFECLVFGTKAGLIPEQMVSVLNAGAGRSAASVDIVPAAVLSGTFDYGGRLDAFHDVVALGLAEAEALKVPMWTTQAVREVWRFAVTQNAGEKDFTTLIRFMEEWAGVAVRNEGGDR